MEEEKLDMRDLHFLDSSCSEDNDSEEDEKDKYEEVVRSIRSQEIRKMKEDGNFNEVRMTLERSVLKFVDDLL
jgi:hypothetical protein